MQKPRISIIVAHGKNRLIGAKNKLLWYLPDDLKRFRALTLGHPVIMGRRTYESIHAVLGKPLSGRTSIVLMYKDEAPEARFLHENVKIVHSTDEALATARAMETDEIFVGGGAMLYGQLLPHTDRLYLTLIDDEKEGDAYFPPYEHLFTKKLSEEPREYDGLRYSWVTLER